ncbi:hypothetical protein CHARACLAT_011666 [Characodon lateralis]|uniref:Uncharacterized protein n=1 Tax=Characodon lateralis TaxID=208331 RepID=A0ABU7DIS2_9TELE|nr:hypothetical protein [Characodon lateralis]
MASLLQHALNIWTSLSPEGAAESPASPPVSEQLLYSRDVTSPNLEKFSGILKSWFHALRPSALAQSPQFWILPQPKYSNLKRNLVWFNLQLTV